MQRPRMQAWLKRRLPPTDVLTLDRKRIFIFLSPEGTLFGFLLIALFVGGINYANNLVLGLCFLLGALLVVTMHHTYAQLSGLKLKALGGDDIEAGQTALYRFEISATGSRPHHQIRLSLGQQHIVLQHVLAPREIAFEVSADRRGVYHPSRLTVSCTYPLGLMRAWSYWEPALPLWVWPRPQPCSQQNGLRYLPDSESDIPSTQAGQEEFAELRNHIPGESLSRVAWAHLARGQGWLSKQYVDPVGQDVLLDYAQMPAASHEDKLAQLSYWVTEIGERQARAFTLVLPQSRLALSNGPQQVAQARRLLAQS